MTDYMKEAERLPELHREIVDDALEVVDTFGPWGMDINEDLRRQIVLADEVRQLRKLYLAAVKGRQEMRSALRDARAALLAHIQRGAVPEGYVAVPRFLAENHRNLTDVPRYQRILDDCLAAAPDHFRDAAEMVVEPAEAPDGWEYYYKDNDCPAADSGDPNCICWHDEGRGPYNNARHDDEDTFLEWRRAKAPAPAEVPMPEPDLWLKQTSSAANPPHGWAVLFTPNGDASQVYLSSSMNLYGDAREAAGYARGRKEAKPDAAADGNERAEWENAVFTLMGHAASLYANGQNDMPNWFYGLAEKIARQHADEALATRVREVGIQQRAALDAAPRGEVTCKHGVRSPHECKACADEPTDTAIAEWLRGEGK